MATKQTRFERPQARRVRPRPAGPRALSGRARPVALALVAYGALATAAFWHVLPVVSTRLPTCACGDQVQEVWFLAWIAHALTHGLNPFFTDYLNYPHGVNLALNTSMPLLGVLFAPVTLALGPVAAYNLLLPCAFVASAIAMCLVARRFTARWAPAFAAGALYGFSPYVIGQGEGHAFLAFVALPPVMFLLVFDLATGRATHARRSAMLLGLLGAAQFAISVEVLVGTALAFALGGAVALVAGGRRPDLRRALAPATVALATFVPLVAYPAYALLAGPQHVSGAPRDPETLALYRADLLGGIVPTIHEWLAPAGLAALGTRFGAGNLGENGIYLGLPLCVLCVVVALRYRRDRLVRVVAATGAVAYLLALGPRLTVANHATGFPLPGALLGRLPFLQELVPLRFSLSVQLAAALLLAVGLDRLARSPGPARGPERSWRPVLAAGLLAAIVLAPVIPRLPYPAQPTALPAYFARGAVAIPPGSVVATYPYDITPNNQAMLWQAVTAMRFKIVGGEATTPRPGGEATTAVEPLPPTELQNLFRAAMFGSASPVHAPPLDRRGLARVGAFFSRWQIHTAVLDPVGADPVLALGYLSALFGRPPHRVGGVDVWYEIACATPKDPVALHRSGPLCTAR